MGRHSTHSPYRCLNAYFYAVLKFLELEEKMPVRFHPMTESNNQNRRFLKLEENNTNEFNENLDVDDFLEWSKGKFLPDPEGLRRAAAVSERLDRENHENKTPILSGPYARSFRRTIAEHATHSQTPLTVEGFVITEIVDGKDTKKYAKLCDIATGVCVMVAMGAMALGTIAGLQMKGGKTRVSRKRNPRRRQTRRRTIKH